MTHEVIVYSPVSYALFHGDSFMWFFILIVSMIVGVIAIRLSDKYLSAIFSKLPMYNWRNSGYFDLAVGAIAFFGVGYLMASHIGFV